MKRSSSLILCLSLSLAVPPATVAHAEPGKSELDAARKKFEKALELEKDGEWKQALALLKEVEQVKVSSQVLFHIALCHEKLGSLIKGLAGYKRAREEAETKEGKEGATMIKKCDDRIKDLEERIPWVEVTVKDDVVSAKASVDGADPFSLLVTPSFMLDPGDHEIVVTSPGRKKWKKKFTLKEKDPKLVMKAKLPREDDNDAEEGGEPVAAPKTVTPVAPVQKPARPASKYDVVPWAVSGVGVALLGTAAVMYVLRSSAISDLDAACGGSRDRCPPDKRSLEDSGKSYTTAGNVFLGLGFVAVGTGVVLYAVRPWEAKTVGTVSLQVAVAPTGASLLGAF